MEEELRDSEERLRILFEYAPDGYYLNDLKGTFIDGNKVAEEITGYKRKELIGNNFLKLGLLSAREISKAATLLAKNIKMKPTGPDEFNLKRKNGSQVPVEISTYPVKIKGKTHVLGIARDISERRRTEQELRENESRFRALVEQSLVGIYIFSKEHFIYVNEAFAGIFGYRPDELISRLGHEDLIHPEDLAVVREQVRNCFRNKTKSAHYIFRGLRKDGSVIFCEVFGRKIKLEDELVIIGSLVDITKRINAEKALTKREKELEIKSHSLEDSNIALNVLLKKRENDKIELQEDILSNVEELIMPFIEKLKICHLSSDQCMYVNIIETNMKNLVSPFLRTLSFQYAKFTPKEIQVAGLVKEGKTAKETADLLHMSIRAVEFHRDNIRDKLGLKNKKVNLRTYLLSLEGNSLP